MAGEGLFIASFPCCASHERHPASGSAESDAEHEGGDILQMSRQVLYLTQIDFLV